jgi:hypothetical protein
VSRVLNPNSPRVSILTGGIYPARGSRIIRTAIADWLDPGWLLPICHCLLVAGRQKKGAVSRERARK